MYYSVSNIYTLNVKSMTILHNSMQYKVNVCYPNAYFIQVRVQ